MTQEGGTGTSIPEKDETGATGRGEGTTGVTKGGTSKEGEGGSGSQGRGGEEEEKQGERKGGGRSKRRKTEAKENPVEADHTEQDNAGNVDTDGHDMEPGTRLNEEGERASRDQGKLFQDTDQGVS